VAASLALLALLPLTRAPTQGPGITVGTNTVFRPSQSWTDIRFSSERTFLAEVATGPTSVTFDGVSIGVEKIPRRLPRAEMEITTWAPQADSTSTAIEFVAETAPGDTMWFNVTGLRADAVYDVHVDTVRQSRSRDAGGISFSWSFSASHTFRLVAFVDTGSPVAIVNARQESSVGETVTFDGSGSHDDTGIIRHEWAFGDGTTAQGESVQYAYRFEGSYSVTLNVWDAVGNSGSASLTVRVSPAAPDNIPPFSVMDLRAAAIGENYVVLVWTAPGDDGDTGQASSYDVRYRTAGPTNSDNFDTSTPVPTPVPKPAGALEQLNVSGLASETIYWFAIRVADEVPNWSPVSNPVEVLTSEDPSASGPERPPAVNGVWFTPSFSQLDVVFSKSMNRSSVGQSLIINPRVPFRVDWVNDAHVTLFLQAQLLEGTAYLLTVEPQAADRSGNVMGSRFSFQFMGAVMPTGVQDATVLPAPLMIPLLAGLVGLVTGWLPLALLLTRSRRKTRTLQGVVVAQAKRIMELRGRNLPRKADLSREILSFRGRK